MLNKATLKSLDGGENIEFMFNPSQLAFQTHVETNEERGSRTQNKGKTKVSFANIKANKITISNILFDTYEEGEDVIKKYIEKFKKAVEFSQAKKRTPIYQFIWGDQVYMRRCFVENLNYKLTMFLPEGTPVRAVIDSLTLKEADERKPNQSVSPRNPSPADRKTDTMANRDKKPPQPKPQPRPK